LAKANGVEFLIVGAFAMAFHGRPRYTGDLDIFVRRNSDNAERLMKVMREFGFGSTGLTRDDFLRENFVIQLGIEPNRIDLLTGISGVDFEDAWRTRELGRLATEEVWFINRDLLIQNKRSSNRDKDLADIRLLERTRPRRKT
jgi:hypothetical protein